MLFADGDPGENEHGYNPKKGGEMFFDHTKSDENTYRIKGADGNADLSISYANGQETAVKKDGYTNGGSI